MTPKTHTTIRKTQHQLGLSTRKADVWEECSHCSATGYDEEDGNCPYCQGRGNALRSSEIQHRCICEGAVLIRNSMGIWGRCEEGCESGWKTIHVILTKEPA